MSCTASCIVELTVAARESFMIVKRDSARAPSISGEKFVAAITVAAFPSAVGAPSDRTIASSKSSGRGELAGPAV